MRVGLAACLVILLGGCCCFSSGEADNDAAGGPIQPGDSGMDDFRQTKAIAVHPEGRGAQVGEMRAPRKAPLA
jgi:hypothetical protein